MCIKHSINNLMGLWACPCFNRMVERQVSREVVDGGSAHVWLDLTSMMKYKKLEECIEITADILDRFTDKLFVFVVRPADRLHAPEEAPRCLSGLCIPWGVRFKHKKSEIPSLNSGWMWYIDTLWIILGYGWSLLIKWPLETPSCVICLQAFVDHKLGSMSYLVSLPIKVKIIG